MICKECNRETVVCEAAQYLSSTDLAALLALAEFGYESSVERVIEQWRGHALPACDPLSIV